MNFIANKKIQRLFFILLACIFYFFLFYLYNKESVSFAFVDEFNNIVAGYFMTKGRHLYSQIFFNHQMMMVYISYGIQTIFHPQTLYKLIMYHRLFIVLFSLFSDIFLLFRFRKTAMGFILFFEPWKFYLFGNLFLGESLVVYPLVYLVGLVWEKMNKHTISHRDILFSGLFCWFVIFTREPFVPAALLLYVCIIFNKKFTVWHKSSFVIFLLLSMFMLSTVNLQEYFYQIVTINSQTIVSGEIAAEGVRGIGIGKIFLYPLLLFIGGTWNFFRIFLLSLDIVFLLLFFVTVKTRKYMHAGFIFLVLGLVGIRITAPGLLFYGAYRLIVWYGLFIFLIFSLLQLVQKEAKTKRLVQCTKIFLLVIFLAMLFYPKTFIWEKVNKEVVFAENYGRFYASGEVIKRLADKNDTLYIDYWDTLIYWQANVKSSYPYALYLPIIQGIPKYTIARNTMFEKDLPDFYYTECDKSHHTTYLSPKILQNYIQLNYKTTPVCIYMKKAKVLDITEAQRAGIRQLDFYLPDSNP